MASNHHARARAPNLDPPERDNAAELGSKGGAEGQGKADSLDCAPARPADQLTAADAKRLATLRATLALAGWTLTDSPGNPHGAFITTPWAIARELRRLLIEAAASVESALRQIGGCSVTAIQRPTGTEHIRLREALDDIRDDLANRVGTLTMAAKLLAAHRPVHEAIESAANRSAELYNGLRDACRGWCDPTANDDANDVLPDLLWLACEELGRVVEKAEGVPVPEVSMRESVQ